MVTPAPASGGSRGSERGVEDLEIEHELARETIALLREEREVDQRQIENLQVALTTARRIGTAVGILMAESKISTDAAFELLRMASQNTHRKLRDVADEVVETGALPD